MNLLIVDDEYYIVQGLVRIIQQEFSVFEQIFQAYSIEQAKKIIERESIQILITDIEMPQETGLSLISWIQNNDYSILCLILTGHQRFDYAQKALNLHCFNYILKPVDKSVLTTELQKAVDSINEMPTTQQDFSKEMLSEDESDDFITKVRIYIYSNLASQDLNRTSIADYVHMNPDYLSCVFRQKFNQTLSTYITQIRMDKAKDLLLRTNWSLDVIAEKTGFSSSSYFHKQFKKVTGVTPQQFRGK